MKRIVFTLVLVSGLSVFAAENDGGRGGFQRGSRGEGQRAERGFRGGFQRGGQNRNMMMRNQFFVEVEIAKKFPAEYAEVDKLREEYEAKLAELAKKAEVQLPESRDSAFRKLHKAYPAEFAAAVEKMKSSPREGFMALNELAKKAGIDLFGAMRGGNRPGGHGQMRPEAPAGSREFKRPDMAALRRNYPEEMKKYDELRRTDAAKARELLVEIIKKANSGKN